MAGLYAADGSWNITIVDGTTYTGLFAADGSINCVIAPVVTRPIGLNHPCGARWVTDVSAGDSSTGRSAADGSLKVCTTPYTQTYAQRVTVVSGSLSVSSFVPSGYSLVFNDEFEGSTLDQTKWWTRYNFAGDSAQNDDVGVAGTLDRFTGESRLDKLREAGNHIVSNSTIKLTAIPPIAPALYWTSGCIRAKKTFKYGYYEIRMKPPAGMAEWSTFWLSEENWALGGEIDIVESVRINGNATGDLDALNMSVKSNSANNEYSILSNHANYHSDFSYYKPAGFNFNEGFHIVGCLWDDDDTVTLYIDGVQIVKFHYKWIRTTGVAAGPATLIANLGIGGGAGSTWLVTPPDVPNTNQVYEIDYIRVYQRPAIQNVTVSTMGRDYTILQLPLNSVEALLARMTVQPDATMESAIRNYYAALVSSGVAFDAFYETALHTEQAGLLNWFGQNSAAPVGSPVWTVKQGYAFNGTTQYLDMMILANGNGNAYKINSASFGVGCNTAAAVAGTSGADVTGSFALSLECRNATNQFRIRMNDLTASTIANTDGKGLFIATRTAAGTKTGFMSHDSDGVVTQTDFAIASTNLPITNRVHVANTTTTFTAIAANTAFLGGAVTLAQAQAISAARLAFRAAVGAT